ncbi:fibronectin type III domain-containing protein [Butyrivibrio sp. AD3002]|uniref:fibronectin type III domain-containing protein n=1 Tax=Butyrivibrio sp. AD3002 TaxID=1280670 RepID=UPI0003B42257|nr:fibronectin type III domain-containing protein [Butyrivibrio sp. AD3002]
MRKRLFKVLGAMLATAMLFTAVPVSTFIGPDKVNAEEDEDVDEELKIKAPAKVKNINVKKMKKVVKITWGRVAKNCKGYEIQVSPYKSFEMPEEDYDSEEDIEYEEIQEFTNEGKGKTFVRVTGLKKKGTYYIRVRAFNENDEGIKYGKWSKVKKYKFK